MAPIRLAETRGCPGATDMRGRIQGVCVCCELQGRPGEQIEPAVFRDAEGVNDCRNRRSTGAVHVVVDGGSVTVEG